MLAPSVAAKLVSHVRQPRRDLLSAGRPRCWRWSARGLTNAEIGRQLSITEATVKTHLIRSFGKLGVNDRTAAVTSAIALGAIASPGR